MIQILPSAVEFVSLLPTGTFFFLPCPVVILPKVLFFVLLSHSHSNTFSQPLVNDSQKLETVVLCVFVFLIAWFAKTQVATGTGCMLWPDLHCDGRGKCSGLKYFNFIDTLWFRLLCGLAPAFVFIYKCVSFHCQTEVRAIVLKALAASINTVSLLWCAKSALSPVQRFHGVQDLKVYRNSCLHTNRKR